MDNDFDWACRRLAKLSPVRLLLRSSNPDVAGVVERRDRPAAAGDKSALDRWAANVLTAATLEAFRRDGGI